MDSTLQALIVKKFKDAQADLDVGRHWIEETVVLRVSGSVERRAGRTDVSDLKVSVNALTPVLEPLYAVA